MKEEAEGDSGVACDACDCTSWMATSYLEGGGNMDPVIATHLSELKLGELRHFKRVGIIPLFVSENDGPEYLTLKEALDQDLLLVTEVGSGGSVPELKATNKSDRPVLLLDGEELAGAKQNRVLNTTILLKEESETIIPVSCTEQGRWSRVSETLKGTDHVLAGRLRTAKAASVSYSLKRSRRFESDQGEMWGAIKGLDFCLGVQSPTGAMKDIFESRGTALDEYVSELTCVPDQKGLLVFIRGRLVGFDTLSLTSAYSILHRKLVKSYAMDALIQRKEKDLKPPVSQAREFLRAAAKCKERKYESVGHGWDHRLEGESIVGSALVYQGKVVHMALFPVHESDRAGRMAGFMRRRGFRT
ncbi:MAG: hypothetical protein JSV10_09240 [Candidatus Zixiibacteriota bacterium]|nr:MAG: hypothetical protein JSV10_09240 [candidate division Zixibacteria bacterium]